MSDEFDNTGPPDNGAPFYDGSDDVGASNNRRSGNGGEHTPADDIDLLAFTAEQILGPIEPEAYALPGVPQEAYTLIAGSLSSFKTTLLLYLIVWKATGWDILGLDERGNGIDIGKAVLITYEDTDKRIFAKLQRVIQHVRQNILERSTKEDADRFVARAAANIRRVICSGRIDRGLVRRIDGMIVPNEFFLQALTEKVRAYAPEGALIGIDPLRLAITGSQNDDDGADIVVHTLNRLATAIPSSAVIACSHSTKASAKEPGKTFADAAYATSGSALYSQHARSNFMMARISAEKALAQFARKDITAEEATKQFVARLTHGRLSHGATQSDVYLVMRQGSLARVAPASSKTVKEDMLTTAPHVIAAIDRMNTDGLKVSGNALEHDPELLQNLGSRAKVRDALKLLLENGYLEATGKTSNRTFQVTAKGRHLPGESERESPESPQNDSA
jgi:RecA-family ATPase